MANHSEDQKLLQAAMTILCEHYDSVQIFVTRHEPVLERGTVEFDCGMGNYFARVGQINMWLKKQEESVTDWIFEVDTEDEGEDEGEDL